MIAFAVDSICVDDDDMLGANSGAKLTAFASIGIERYFRAHVMGPPSTWVVVIPTASSF